MIENELKELGISSENLGTSTGNTWFGEGDELSSYSPVDGKLIGKVKSSTKDDYEVVIKRAQSAFKEWRMIPAPKRGEIVRQFGDKLREKKASLGKLVSYEMGKSYQEGLGEVQ